MASRSRVRYGTTVIKRMEIANNDMGDCSATNMTGFAINGTTAYCVKRNNSIDKATIYTIANFASAVVESSKKIIQYATYGMTYYSSNLYIASKASKIIRVPATTTSTTATEFDATTDATKLNPQAIAHYTENKFILMANSLNSGTDILCFAVGTFNESTKKFDEHTDSRFYVKNTGNAEGFTQVQDIYYDPVYGLFIVMNEKVNGAYTTSNLILRTDMKRIDGSYNGKNLYYPVAEFKFVGKAAEYSQLNVESVAIDSEGKMYAVTNLVAVKGSEGFTKDGMFYIGNVRFNTDKPFWLKVYGRNVTTIPDKSGSYDGKSYICNVPGALALNGKVGYCIKTDTRTVSACRDNASFFYKTNDYLNTPFAAQGSVLKMLGHGNGMAYSGGYLYVAAYAVNDRTKRDIVKLTTGGSYVESYHLNDMKVGAISAYKNNKFILQDYKQSTDPETFHFLIGMFSGTSFNVEKKFEFPNPAYTGSGGVYQDIHYSPVFGLFATTSVSGDEYIVRVSAEKIDEVLDGGEVVPDGIYLLDKGIAELESLYLADDGILYYTENTSTDKEFSRILTLNYFI